jgi:dTDP-4-dehydrorhamnose reductase
MKYKTILITGASGKLGQALTSHRIGGTHYLTPTRQEMDITDRKSVEDFVIKHKIDGVIHCAALTNMAECEKNPGAAVNINIIGTVNIVQAFAKVPSTRFVYLSTDYVYPSTLGPYSEEDVVAPFNVYAWTKLGGEYAVKSLPNCCIIRTSFFNPDSIPFDTAPIDAFCSKIPFSEGAKAIMHLLESDFVGTINVGREKISFYDLFKQYKPHMKPVTLEEINKTAPIKRAADSSLDVSLWKKLSR